MACNVMCTKLASGFVDDLSIVLKCVQFNWLHTESVVGRSIISIHSHVPPHSTYIIYISRFGMNSLRLRAPMKPSQIMRFVYEKQLNSNSIYESPFQLPSRLNACC